MKSSPCTFLLMLAGLVLILMVLSPYGRDVVAYARQRLAAGGGAR